MTATHDTHELSDAELDRRARSAAHAVQRITVSIESPDAADQRRRQQRQARTLGVAVVVVLVLPLLALALVHRSPTDDQNAGPDTTSNTTASTTTAPGATHPATLNLTPGSPTDGKGSKGFPVDATPFADLQDQQTITLTGSGFPAQTMLGAVMCTTEAAEGGGADYCDLGTVTYINSDADGSFTSPFTVSRLFRTSHGSRDCAESNIDPAQFKQLRDADQHPSLRQPGAWGCIVAVAAVSDYDQSGGFPVTFGPGPVPTLPPTTAAPAPVVPRVTAQAGKDPNGTIVMIPYSTDLRPTTTRGTQPG